MTTDHGSGNAATKRPYRANGDPCPECHRYECRRSWSGLWRPCDATATAPHAAYADTTGRVVTLRAIDGRQAGIDAAARAFANASNLRTASTAAESDDLA